MSSSELRALSATVLAFALTFAPIAGTQQPAWSQSATRLPAAPQAPPPRALPSNATNIEIAHGQDLLVDVAYSAQSSGRAGLVNLPGDIKVGAGSTLFAISTNPQIQHAIFYANNIVTSPGATITTTLPINAPMQFNGAINGLNLSLIARQNLSNQGTISSAGILNLIAGNVISNGNSITHAANAAVIQANGDVNILTPTLINRGIVTSGNNININNTPATFSALSNLLPSNELNSLIGSRWSIDSKGGYFIANAGTITIGSENNAGTTLNLTGGSYISNSFTVNVGHGSVAGSVEKLSGILNLSADIAHLGSRTPTLTLGSVKVDGDPTFFNIGNIHITSSITVAEDLAILAAGNISIDPNIAITAVDGAGNGRNIFLAAGANLVANNATPASATIPGVGPITNGTVSLNGASPSGGSILGSNTAINSSGAKGGNITLLAFKGSAATGSIQSLAVDASGTTTQNGNVVVYAGGDNGSGIAISNVSVLSSGAGSPGSVTIAAANPIAQLTFNSNGIGTGVLARGALTSAGISYQSNPGIVTNGGTINLTAGSVQAVATSFSSAGTQPGRNGGALIITSSGTVNIDGSLDSSGSSAIASPTPGAAGNPGGNAAPISISGTTLTLANINAAGGNGASGGNGAAGASGGSGGAGGTGGSVTLTASTTLDLHGTVNTSGGTGGDGGAGGNGTTAQTGGNGGIGGAGGSAGNLTISTGSSGANTITGIITATGGAGGFGAAGGAGGSSSNGGQGGDGGAGGSSGNVFINGGSSFTTSDIITNSAVGGSGGAGGSGGDASGAGPGGNGGSGGAIAAAGRAGNITLISQALTLTTLTATGSIGLDGGHGGDGGAGINAIGGNGGNGGDTTRGANGGNISLTILGSGALSISTLVDVSAENQNPSCAGAGGNGGNGASGGNGGRTGQGNDGGACMLVIDRNLVPH